MNKEQKMDKSNNDLLKKLEALEIGSNDCKLSFEKRLARENMWSLAYTKRLIKEYKRFIYLVAIASQELTPSDQIDQAWHLHLSYTDSYWNNLCHSILGFDLHHNPTTGGKAEQTRFQNQYQCTLDLYAKVFEHKPPPDIWVSTNKRFSNLDQFIRINTAHSWILKNPSFLVRKS